MLRPRLLTLLLIFTSIPFAAAAEPVPVIFDTDISGDVDDVLALAMLHALAANLAESPRR
ncbi:hypothetical protein [Blastopirellula retiformator]|uniref:Inosine-uridine preferring nucleoside hydrolase n=1 Tax=Blastopirellula retiformator TaxID=2527970 RepID=A0A5C5VLH6_9BACT|nr:hypothetical protein [Blastopirellula retiformator]TWT38877.1 hypothetical protein Enr8_05710 [Blastopirellula retiformator]